MPHAGDNDNCYITIVNGACPGAMNEVSMEKIFKCKNGTMIVTLPESCDRDKLKKATEEFLRKVISGRAQNGNSNSTRNFSKE